MGERDGDGERCIHTEYRQWISKDAHDDDRYGSGDIS
jgi:hypothetical protein